MNSEHTKSFVGKTALITGAASGIGWATAQLFCQRGASVVLLDADPTVKNRALELSEWDESSEDHFSICADTTDSSALEEAVALAVERRGHLDIVVGAAATSATGTVLTMDLETWKRVLDVNLNSAFRLAAAAMPALIASRGSLIFIGSQLGLVGTQRSVAYTASKGGVVNLTRALALDHAEDGVRVNCLCPGPTRTAFLTASFARTNDPERAERAALSKVPMRRFAEPSEIAACAAFLASDDASFVTGSSLIADGGYVAQ